MAARREREIGANKIPLPAPVFGGRHLWLAAAAPPRDRSRRPAQTGRHVAVAAPAAVLERATSAGHGGPTFSRVPSWGAPTTKITRHHYADGRHRSECRRRPNVFALHHHHHHHQRSRSLRRAEQLAGDDHPSQVENGRECENEPTSNGPDRFTGLQRRKPRERISVSLSRSRPPTGLRVEARR